MVQRSGATDVGRPKKNPEDSEKFGIVIRGSKEWRDWVMELAALRRMRATDMIDQALVEYAEAHGFKKPAPPR